MEENFFYVLFISEGLPELQLVVERQLRPQTCPVVSFLKK